MKRGKEGRTEGTRAKPGNHAASILYYICIHLLDPHWTMPRQQSARQAVISTQ